VDSLLDKDTKRNVRYALNNLARGSEALKIAYDGAIERIKGQLPGKSARAKDVLSWITYAQRPLTIDELCHALAVEPGDRELDEDNIPEVEDIVSVCAGLVTIDEESRIIRLVHYTTQDYMKDVLHQWNPSAQHDISRKCLTYLCFDTFKLDSCVTYEELRSRLEQYIFLEYSAQYWGHHVFTIQEELSKLAMCLLRNNRLVACVLDVNQEVKRLFWDYEERPHMRATGLHLAASLGLTHFCSELFFCDGDRERALIASKDRDGRTPLLWAVAEEREAVVRLLLDQGAEVDSRDKDGDTALSWAAKMGNETIVKLLLEQGAEVDSRDSCGQTPLSWTARMGHETVVRLLLEQGAEVE
jgi:hypothetical protein